MKKRVATEFRLLFWSLKPSRALLFLLFVEINAALGSVVRARRTRQAQLS